MFFVSAVERSGTIVAAMNDKFGHGDAVWTSRDGVTWTRSETDIGDKAFFQSLSVTSDGFIIGGEGASRRPVVWTSQDGFRWRRTQLARGVGRVWSVASIGGTRIAQGGVEQQPRFWASTDGVRWKRARILGPMHAAGPTRIQRTSAGLILLIQGTNAMRLSRTGSSWNVVAGAPAILDPVTAATPTRHGMLVFGYEFIGPNVRSAPRPWRITLK
jgi:hypothetical protein